VTGELENATLEAASVIIGRALAEATGRVFDAALFSNVDGDADHCIVPARCGVANIDSRTSHRIVR
jgi:hypothetical protein